MVDYEVRNMFNSVQQLFLANFVWSVSGSWVLLCTDVTGCRCTFSCVLLLRFIAVMLHDDYNYDILYITANLTLFTLMKYLIVVYFCVLNWKCIGESIY